MMNLTESKETKYIQQTIPHSYTQKMWMMFYSKLGNNKNPILTP